MARSSRKVSRAAYFRPKKIFNKLRRARAKLMIALAEGGRDNDPSLAANAQVQFDCWMQEQEEHFQPNDIAACRAAFMNAIAKLDKAIAPKPMMAIKKLMMAKHRAERVDVDGIYVVIFDFNSAKLNVESQRVLRKVAAAFKMAKPTGRTMTGHGDLSGASDYNAALTRRRLDAVLGFLLEMGMPSMDLIPSTHGEKKALVPTKDGMREKRNRRGGYLPIGRFSELVTIEEKRARGHGGGSGLNFRLMSHASFFCAVAALAFIFTIVRIFAGIICLMLQVNTDRLSVYRDLGGLCTEPV
jgi:OOP family OmpA-OmpF porin